MSGTNYSIRWYVVHRRPIDNRELACGCLGDGVRESKQVCGHSEHGTGPVDTLDFG